MRPITALIMSLVLAVATGSVATAGEPLTDAGVLGFNNSGEIQVGQTANCDSTGRGSVSGTGLREGGSGSLVYRLVVNVISSATDASSLRVCGTLNGVGSQAPSCTDYSGAVFSGSDGVGAFLDHDGTVVAEVVDVAWPTTAPLSWSWVMTGSYRRVIDHDGDPNTPAVTSDEVQRFTAEMQASPVGLYPCGSAEGATWLRASGHYAVSA